MRWNMLRVAFAAVGVFAAGGPSQAAEILYGATGSDLAGILVTIDTANGQQLSLVGALTDAAGNDYGITGLAFHPTTGVLYGSTTRVSPTAPGSLVTIDLLNARVTPVGSFGLPPVNNRPQTMADLTFDPVTGILYGWAMPGLSDLHTINLTTGLATSVGDAMLATSGSGLASDAGGFLYFAGTGANGNLRVVNKTTGLTTPVANLTGAPFPTGTINALAFSSTGALFGLNSTTSSSPGGGGNTPSVSLVLINLNGTVTELGDTTPGLDALAFRFTGPGNGGNGGSGGAGVPLPGSLWLVGTGGLLVMGRYWRRTMTRNREP